MNLSDPVNSLDFQDDHSCWHYRYGCETLSEVRLTLETPRFALAILKKSRLAQHARTYFKLEIS